MNMNKQPPAASESAAGGTQKSSPEKSQCTGSCLESAKKVFDNASESLRPSGTAGHSDVAKRFQFVSDVAATDPHNEAEILLEHALALYELVYGQEHPSVAEIMKVLAVVYAQHGNKDGAEYMDRWAQEILSRPKEEPTHEFFHLFGMDRPDVHPTGS